MTKDSLNEYGQCFWDCKYGEYFEDEDHIEQKCIHPSAWRITEKGISGVYDCLHARWQLNAPYDSYCPYYKEKSGNKEV